jgi:hypothetical protein
MEFLFLLRQSFTRGILLSAHHRNHNLHHRRDVLLRVLADRHVGPTFCSGRFLRHKGTVENDCAPVNVAFIVRKDDLRFQRLL